MIRLRTNADSDSVCRRPNYVPIVMLECCLKPSERPLNLKNIPSDVGVVALSIRDVFAVMVLRFDGACGTLHLYSALRGSGPGHKPHSTMASGHVNRILRAEHMAAPTSGATWRFSLPTRSRRIADNLAGGRGKEGYSARYAAG